MAGVGVFMVLLASGCKPKVDSSPGRACFVITKAGPENARIENVTTAKVGEELAVDLTCADKCRNDLDLSWGDGDSGVTLHHKYTAPGTYTIKFECSKKTKTTRTRDHKKKTSSSRYQSSKTITITP